MNLIEFLKLADLDLCCAADTQDIDIIDFQICPIGGWPMNF